MTETILSELCERINAQVDVQEALQMQLQQANALVQMSEASDFDQIANDSIHYYLSALMDIVDKANQLSEQLTGELCQWAKILEEAAPSSAANVI